MSPCFVIADVAAIRCDFAMVPWCRMTRRDHRTACSMSVLTKLPSPSSGKPSFASPAPNEVSVLCVPSSGRHQAATVAVLNGNKGGIMPNNTTQDANRYTDGKLCRDASGYMVMQWTAKAGSTLGRSSRVTAPKLLKSSPLSKMRKLPLMSISCRCRLKGMRASVILTAAILMAIFGSWKWTRRSPHSFQNSRRHR